jgi:hypothetical protein
VRVGELANLVVGKGSGFTGSNDVDPTDMLLEVTGNPRGDPLKFDIINSLRGGCIMKTIGLLPFLIAFAVLSIPSAIGQTSEEVRHAPDGGTREMIVSIFIPPIPNAPFTATVNTEWTRRLENGATSTIKNHRTVARDSTGRIFQERRYLTPDGDKHQTPITQLEFSDPSSHELYICKPATRVCELHSYFPSTSTVPAAATASGVRANDLTTEDLGHNVISGLDVLGTRETTTIAPGTIGNDRPLAAVKEFWYSSQLGINLVVNRTDPRAGTENFRVTDINLAEPGPQLLDPPSDFSVVDARKPTPPSK